MAASPLIPGLILALSSSTLPVPSAAATAPVAMGAVETSTIEDADVPEGLSGSSGPRVYIMPKKADSSRGVLKLVQHRNTTTTAISSDTTLVTNTYEELCTEPCGIPIDVSERPLFYFVRDGQPVTHAFRLHDQTGTITLRVKPTKRGLMIAGITLATLIVGIPMWIAASPRVWVAEGRPDPDAAFTRVKKARL